MDSIPGNPQKNNLISFELKRRFSQQRLAEKWSLDGATVEKSAILFRHLIEVNPREVGNYFHLSQIYAQEKKWEQGIALLKQALRHCGPSVALFTRMVELYENSQNPNLKGVLKRFIRHFPREYVPLLKLAELYYRDNNFKGSKKVLFRILEQGISLNEEVYFLLGQNFRHTRDYKKAIGFYRKALETGVNDPLYYFNIGLCFRESQRYDEALGTFRRGLRVPGVNPVFFHLQIGMIHFDCENYEKGLRAFRNVLCYAPKDEAAHHYIGLCHNRLGNHSLALRFFQELEKLNPKYYNIYNNLGNTWYYLKDYRQAIANFQKALEIDPNFEVAHNNIGNLYCELGEFDLGIKYLKRAHELAPDYLLPIGNLANGYKAMKDFSTAEHYYRLLMEKGEPTANTRFQFAYVCYMQKKMGEALEILDLALRIEKDHFESLQLQGAVHFALKDYLKSLEIYRRVLQLQPQSLDTHFNIAMCLLRMEEHRLAITHLTQVSKTFPNDAAIARFLGLSHLNLGENEAAERHLMRSFSLDPRDPLTLDLLSEVALRLGRTEEALKYLKLWRECQGGAGWEQLPQYLRIRWRQLKEWWKPTGGQ